MKKPVPSCPGSRPAGRDGTRDRRNPVGRSFCLSACLPVCMSAVVDILGHFSKTMLLFFIPQVLHWFPSVCLSVCRSLVYLYVRPSTVVAILGHFSITILLFLIPQVFLSVCLRLSVSQAVFLSVLPLTALVLLFLLSVP